MSVEASHQKKRPLVMGDAAEGRRGAAYVFRNTDWLLTLRVNAQPSGKNALILCAKYHSQAMNPQCSCLRAKAAQVSGHLSARSQRAGSCIIFAWISFGERYCFFFFLL